MHHGWGHRRSSPAEGDIPAAADSTSGFAGRSSPVEDILAVGDTLAAGDIPAVGSSPGRLRLRSNRLRRPGPGAAGSPGRPRAG